MHRIAAGDLSEPIALKPGSEGSLLHAMKSMQGQLSDVIGGVHHAVTEVSHAVDALSQGNQALAERTMRQAASLQASASSVEEITASVRHNAESAEHARELAQQSSRQAESGSRAVADAVGTMSEVSQRARKIVEITALIDGIAFQTNILALNAAVEAARAGEQGRGFSVVAGEVRVLAQRAAAASREIKSLIEDSARHIETGAQHVNAAGAAMDELVASVRRVGEYIEHISTASQEQRQGIELVNHAVSELESDTQQNHVMVEEAGQAARALQDVARELGRAVGQFKLEPVALPTPSAPAHVVDVMPRVPLLTA
ncbi:MAG: methyl-accepting chemotaxis protein [Aquabacterium sp.]